MRPETDEMKICRFDDHRLGIVLGDEVADVSALLANEPAIRPWPLPAGDWLIKNLARLRPDIERLAAAAVKKPLADVLLLSPIANPGKIIGAPVNYYAHQDEANADKSISFDRAIKTIEHYGLFLKANSSLVGAGQGVQLRLPERRHDHEGELVAVIGETCANVGEADALDYVAGYCTGLDMTARGVEERSLRKSFDTYTVLGPWLTTADEIANPDDLLIHLAVNGETRQHCSTAELIFGVRKLISYASQFYTLEAGDVIMTGTPAGVGPVLPGDVIDLEIDRLGAMHVAVR
jgi:2-keto-4-pentenoate hydratase/2-oxohepta-3-ene-1,7-dioic acid hydratase in catechol pathway